MKEMIHFIGIGGIGMSALARIALQRGFVVSGSDNAATSITEELSRQGALIYKGHQKDHIKPSMVVVYSTDINSTNPEMEMALGLGLKVVHRSELMGMLIGEKQSLLVTGTHGKTTTSSLLSYTLLSLSYKPTFAVGGYLKNIQANSLSGSGEYFVAEADESDGSFLSYPGYGCIITNIDLDHLNFWKTEQNLIAGFKDFALWIQNKDLLFWCKDDQRLSSLALEGVSYGFDQDSNVKVYNYSQNGSLGQFSIQWRQERYENIIIPLMGKHNALNAAAVFAMCLSLGAVEKEIRSAFLSFKGIARRAEFIGEYSGVQIFDDYGHHPTEIKATLAAFRAAFPSNRLVCLFQPHRFSRTKDCFDGFRAAFDEADVLILTDIYAAGEEPIEGVDSIALYTKIAELDQNDVYYMKKSLLIDFLTGFLRSGDLLLTIGAGDVTKCGPEILSKFSG